MATVKLKFRLPMEGKNGYLFYQITHEKCIRQLKINFLLCPEEWDVAQGKVRIQETVTETRRQQLILIQEEVDRGLKLWSFLIHRSDLKSENYTAETLVSLFLFYKREGSLFTFMKRQVESLRKLGRASCADNYEATYRSFFAFRQGKDLLILEITSELILQYEVWLKQKGVSLNASSFYMRNFRAVYNQAVEKGFAFQWYPFKKVYTGIAKTSKRAVDLKVIRKIRELEISGDATLSYARDLFLFSFYTRGMSFVDMAYLQKSSLKNGILSYQRKKTGKQLSIKWEKCMQEIIDKYDTKETCFLLPIITSSRNERTQYKNASHWVNSKLKKIGELVGLTVPLTMYVARHSWASIAKSKQIPLSVISECMGHDSERTTQIYLASLDTSLIDKANRVIIQAVCKDSF